MANAIARSEAKEWVTEARRKRFLEWLEGVEIIADTATCMNAGSDTLSLTLRNRLSAYDASNLELALREGLPLATLDGDLQ